MRMTSLRQKTDPTRDYDKNNKLRKQNTMATNSKDPAACRIQNVRLSFPSLFKKKASIPGGPEKYRANFLIDPKSTTGKTALAAIQACIKHVELEVFQKSPMKYKSIDRNCLVSGDECMGSKTDEIYEGYEGMMALKCSATEAPSVVDRDPSISLDADDSIPYAGCYVDAYVRFFAVKGDDKGGAGIFCDFKVVQFRKEGPAFGAGKVDAAKVMGIIQDDEDEASDAGDDDLLSDL